MTSKTFESAVTNRTLTVEGFFNGAFSVVFSDDSSRDLILQGDDAPALALAILEAAGVTETDSPYMQEAADNLRAYILIEETMAAEDEAQAKLEDEAAELFKASGAYGSDRLFLKFSDLEDHVQKCWLAVARAARELNKEDGQ